MSTGLPGRYEMESGTWTASVCLAISLPASLDGLIYLIVGHLYSEFRGIMARFAYLFFCPLDIVIHLYYTTQSSSDSEGRRRRLAHVNSALTTGGSRQTCDSCPHVHLFSSPIYQNATFSARRFDWPVVQPSFDRTACRLQPSLISAHPRRSSKGVLDVRARWLADITLRASSLRGGHWLRWLDCQAGSPLVGGPGWREALRGFRREWPARCGWMQVVNCVGLGRRWTHNGSTRRPDAMAMTFEFALPSSSVRAAFALSGSHGCL